jgi:hypothetical protein
MKPSPLSLSWSIRKLSERITPEVVAIARRDPIEGQIAFMDRLEPGGQHEPFAELAPGVPAVEGVSLLAVGCALAPRLVVHSLRRGAVRLMHETDVHMIPITSPRLLSRPFLVEVARPEAGERILGGVTAIGGFPMRGGLFALIFGEPSPRDVAVAPYGCRLLFWRPSWGSSMPAELHDGEANLEALQALHGEELGDRDETMARLQRFLIVAALLLEAEGAPLQKVDEPMERRGAARSRGPGAEWVTRRVYLAGESRPSDSDPGREPDAQIEGRIPDEVRVRGHLKRQPVGPRGAGETRWIYVESYEARRWVLPRPVRVEVSARER